MKVSEVLRLLHDDGWHLVGVRVVTRRPGALRRCSPVAPIGRPRAARIDLTG